MTGADQASIILSTTASTRAVSGTRACGGIVNGVKLSFGAVLISIFTALGMHAIPLRDQTGQTRLLRAATVTASIAYPIHLIRFMDFEAKSWEPD
jgi:hypothetical protein